MRPSALGLSLIIPAIIPAVVAHGSLYEVTIAGQLHMGNVPENPPIGNASIIRQIDAVSPVLGTDNPFLTCGQGAPLAADVASAMPGDAVTLWWRGGDLQNWPHNTGPIMTYMASCGDTPCNQYNGSDAQWFKISQLGQQSDGTWYQSIIMNGGVANATIPSNIAPGNYLMRHELIALQNAATEGLAEFYPSCVQLTIGGSGTGVPTADETCTFPGCYSETDPGIYDPTVYDPGSSYTFPGPPVAAFVTAGSPGASNSTTASGSSPSGTSTSDPGSSSGSGGYPGSGGSSTSWGHHHHTCHLVSPSASASASVYPRRISRIMRDLHHARNAQLH